MTLLQAIESPRKYRREATIEPGVRRGKLVTTAETRIGDRGAREVLCNCDCGQQAWRTIQDFRIPRYMTCGCSRKRTWSEAKKKERNRRWEAVNRDHRREYQKKWKEENPGAVAQSDYLSKLVSSAPHERIEINDLYKLAKSSIPVVCCYCGRVTVSKQERHVDHRTPRSRGGSHLLGNLAIACAECNLQKHAKTEAEFLLLTHQIEEPFAIG